MTPPRHLVVLLGVVAACGSESVAPERPASIAFTVAPDTMFALSDTVALIVTVKSESGAELPGAMITFSSSAENVGVVTPDGQLVSRGVGTTRVAAASGSLQTFVDVVVRQKLSAVSVSRATLRLGAGRTALLAATPVDSRGNAIPGLAPTFFSAVDSTIVRVSGGGMSTGLRPGSTRIIARVAAGGDGAREGGTNVTVVALQVSPVVGMGPASFSPATIDIAAGGTVRFANDSGVAHDVDFAGALDKIPAHISGESSRTFSVPGAFPFHCNLHAGMTGTVFVSL